MDEQSMLSALSSFENSNDDDLPGFILNALHQLWNRLKVDCNEIDESLFHIVQVPLSAQQKVWILRVPPCENEEWQPALRQGNHHVVIRLWKNSCNWWNCNYQPVPEVHRRALSEVTAYRIAYQLLSQLCIPRVLHFASDPLPWAILEYVGPYSREISVPDVWETSFLDSMIPVRHEFGFDEPHPRWGRLPVESCDMYGDLLLQQVIIPLHRQWQSQSDRIPKGLVDSFEEETMARGLRYFDMVHLYQRLMSNVLAPTTDRRSSFISSAIILLQQVIKRLEVEADEQGLMAISESSSSPPCVPCHMDLQPQNLTFARSNQSTVPIIVSVLDWEDAAYADCRFELLMMGRKVMANRQQADRLWKSYEVAMGVPLGPIEPWLRLETTHSLISLLLQAVAGGGRNSWEQLDDIQCKVSREFHRLEELEWEFCSSIRKDYPSPR